MNLIDHRSRIRNRYKRIRFNHKSSVENCMSLAKSRSRADRINSGKDFYDKNSAVMDNRGFSLLELILSILILALIIPPLLNHFVASMRINAEAKQVQHQNILAQSLMEEIKGKSLEVILREFNYPEGGAISYEAKPDGSGGYLRVQEAEQSCIRTELAGPTGNYYEYSFTERTDKPYYFVRKGVECQGVAYDILLTLDGTVYQGTDPGGNPVGYNTFRMPILKEISPYKDVIAVQSYEEEMAAAYLFGNHFSYCLAEEELHEAEPAFEITYHTLEEIRDKLNKKIRIHISQSGSELRAEVLFEYTCPDYPGCGLVNYTIASEMLPDREGDIYIFYLPSEQDEIIVTKDPFLTGEPDIHLYRQSPVSDSVNPESITIPEGIKLYSNVSFPGIPANPVKKAFAGNRIYRMKVQLFAAGSNFSMDSLCLELTSTKE